jgi:hypothetical protein
MVVVLFVWLAAMAQSTPPPVPPPSCDAAPHAQFDFWLGEWDVFGPKGNRAGRNSITKTHRGCVVLEQWTGNGGVTGSSFNIYTPATSQWHQIWVDNAGTLLQLAGGFRDGAMRMQGEGLTPKGTMLNRITWTPQADGTVRQFWETSVDKGATWQTAFDGTYRKAGAK